jgi:hypothetical protein
VTDVIVLDDVHPGRRVPGGYAAWEADRRRRRGAQKAAPAIAAPSSPPARRPVRTAPAKRSPSTLRRLLRDVERVVAALEKRRAALTTELGAAGGDHETLARAGTELAAVEEELAAAEHHWLELAGELDAYSS